MNNSNPNALFVVDLKTFPNIVLFQVLMLFAYTSITSAQTTTDDIQHITTISENLEAPLRIASDELGNTYVADAFSKAISKFDPSGNFLETIRGVKEPVSVAINSEGQLFIGDGATGFIYRYHPSSGAIEFYTDTKYPSAMEFGLDDVLYVADSELKQVLALDLSGNVVQTMGGGILDVPTGIAVDNNKQRILVGEHGGAGTGFSPTVRVYMFDLQGTLVNSFGSHGNTDGKFYRIQGLTVGRCGNIYVLDPYQARVSIFDENGTFITKFGDFGLQSGELNVPMDIVFDSQERLLLTSMNNGALEIFSISDTLPSSSIKSESVMICSGEVSDIEIAFTGTAPWSFTYTIDGLNPTVVNTSENPYTLSVSDAGHYEVIALSDANYSGTCFTGSADVIVANTAPTAIMTGDAVICAGEKTEIAIDFTGSPPWSFNYTLDGENPTSVTTTNNPYVFEVSEAGLYAGSGLTGGACTGTSFTGSADISVNPLPTATMTDGNGQVFIDPGEPASLPVELTGSSPWTITYTVDDRDPEIISDINEGLYSIISSKAGSYEVKEVSDAWCTSNASLGYPEVVINQEMVLPTSHMDGGAFSICPDESVPVAVHFTGMAPWTFTYAVDTTISTTIFNTYSNPYIINALYEGTYEVIALSDNMYAGTEFTGNALVSILLPVPDFTHTVNMLEVSFNNISVDADSYYWDFGDGSNSVETNPVHLYQSEGEFVVSLTGISDLCDDITLTRSIQIEAVSVESAEFDGFLSIYPNPTDGIVTIEINSRHNTEVIMEIIDVNGKMAYSGIFPSGSVAEEINLASFSSGLYFVRIITKDYFGIRKLILSTN